MANSCVPLIPINTALGALCWRSHLLAVMEQWGVYAVAGSASGSGTMRNLHVSGEMPWGTNSCVSDYCLFLIPIYIYIYI